MLRTSHANLLYRKLFQIGQGSPSDILSLISFNSLINWPARTSLVVSFQAQFGLLGWSSEAVVLVCFLSCHPAVFLRVEENIFFSDSGIVMTEAWWATPSKTTWLVLRFTVSNSFSYSLVVCCSFPVLVILSFRLDYGQTLYLLF